MLIAHGRASILRSKIDALWAQLTIIDVAITLTQYSDDHAIVLCAYMRIHFLYLLIF